MNERTAAIAVGFLVFFSIGGGFIYFNDTEETNDPVVSVIAKVNSNGSGIFCRYDLDINDPEGWGGKVFMTPGPGSIQHEMLKTLAFSLGYYFALDGPAKNNNTVYFTIVTPGQMSTEYKKGYVDGGIAWEPAFSRILHEFSDNTYNVATSDEIEPDHPCCMIVATHAFIEKYPDTVLRFLLAYIEALEWANDAKEKGSGPEYEKLLDVSVSVALPGVAGGHYIAADALENIDFSSELTNLKEDVVALLIRFENSGSITNPVSDKNAFADMLVNGSFLEKVKDMSIGEKEDMKDGEPAHIRLGVLTADLHQIAVEIAMADGIKGEESPSLFKQYGLNVVKVTASAGAEVMGNFATGSIDMGVLGLPPTVIRSANGL